jgi:hypothetical protein
MIDFGLVAVNGETHHHRALTGTEPIPIAEQGSGVCRDQRRDRVLACSAALRPATCESEAQALPSIARPLVMRPLAGKETSRRLAPEQASRLGCFRATSSVRNRKRSQCDVEKSCRMVAGGDSRVSPSPLGTLHRHPEGKKSRLRPFSLAPISEPNGRAKTGSNPRPPAWEA